jgi:signal transduction histidine kinase
VENLALHFFPFPHVTGKVRRPGALIDWPERCSGCDRQCETSTANDLSLCSYGLNYLRVDDDLLIAGIVVNDYPGNTPARQKMKRRLGNQGISKKSLERIVDLSRSSIEQLEAELDSRFEQVVSEYRESQGYYEEIVERIRPEMQQALAQVHDYKQFVQQIIQNMDVLLEERFPERSLTDKIEGAKHEEAAIYWAAEMMDEKLEAVAFLQFPERIQELTEQGRFSLHGMVLKYVRIYQRKADQRGLSISVSGECWTEIEGNTRALGIIPHTLIDNATKYAPENSRVEIIFEELAGDVEFSVRSFGPAISTGEQETIFDPFVRGAAAREMRREGTGFGLAAAQAIARAHDTQIKVKQTKESGPEDTYMTTFQVKFEGARSGNRSIAR